MRPTRFQPKDALQAFAQKKVCTRPELLRACGCSTMTAWRILHREGYLTSYSHNARYYTLARIPRFDEQGLWAYQGIRFSKWGSLSKTVVGLVEQSPAGMTASELEKALHVPNLKPLLTRLAGQAQGEHCSFVGVMRHWSAGMQRLCSSRLASASICSTSARGASARRGLRARRCPHLSVAS